MACKQPSPAVIDREPLSLRGHIRARSLAAALTFDAGVALSAVAAGVSSATAQELEWATSAGGADIDFGLGIATDPPGNSYVTGHFSDTATFGEGEANQTVLISSVNSFDAFVAKYAPDGTLLWAKRAGGIDEEAGRGIATDPRGNSYVTGYFSGTATFGEGEANQTALEAAGEFDIFVAKYFPSGALLWAKRAGGNADRSSNIPDEGRSIATDPRGNSYVTGRFFGTATFGEGEANQTVLKAAGEFDIFVAKYSPSGALLWAKRAGGTGGDFGDGVATDPRGEVYVTGEFGRNARTATFGEGEANETVLTSAGFDVLYVAKYAPNGTLLWAKSADCTVGDCPGFSIATDPRGNSYVTGEFERTARFGAGEANETVLISSVNSFDAFVAKYAPDGTLLWAKSAGGFNFDQGLDIATDPRGNSYVIGHFFAAATFGAEEANETVLVGTAETSDTFVAKYAPSGTLLWAESAVGAEGYGVATNPRGNSFSTGGFQNTATFGAGETNETELEAVASNDVFVAKYGVRNDQDECPQSDQSATVVIDGYDTGVENVLTNTDGCTILDLIRQASDDAADRAEFIRGVALLSRTLLRDGLITAEEAGILRTAASEATFPLS